MRRRDFIALSGGAAVVCPLTVRAQQPARPVIGFLRSSTAADSMRLVRAFRESLKSIGYDEGQNVEIEYRYAENRHDRLAALAADLVRRPVTVIVGNTISALAAKAATAKVPIVFVTGSDPVADKLVASLNRPSGNVTGVVFFSGVLAAKRLELIRQLVPKAQAIAALVYPNTLESQAERTELEAAAQAIGQRLEVVDVSSAREIDPAFATFVRRGAGALLVGSGAFLYSHRQLIIGLAARHALPAIYALSEFVAAGGLMSYAASITDGYRQAAIHVGRILKGEKPAEMPVMRSTKFEFVVNLKTAKVLDLVVPDTLLVAATEVIE